MKLTNSHSSNVKSRTMDRLEHGRVLPSRIKIARRSNANAASKGSSKIGKNISVL